MTVVTIVASCGRNSGHFPKLAGNFPKLTAWRRRHFLRLRVELVHCTQNKIPPLKSRGLKKLKHLKTRGSLGDRNLDVGHLAGKLASAGVFELAGGGGGGVSS